jgi:magnesium transporter
MLCIYKTINDKVYKIDEFEKGSWISLIDPDKDEIEKVVAGLSLDPDLIKAALDEEETARLELEEGQSLVIVDIPVVEPEGGSFMYSTIPLGIVRTDDNIITICLRETTIIEDFAEGRVKTFDTFKKTRFTLQLLYKNSSKFLQYLRRIDKASMQVETALHRSMKNRELIEMLKLEKSLVFFSTSLKSNEIVLEKMLKTNAIKRYPEDEDLLEDVIVENKQAIEMCTIYRDILSGTMDAFASVISNNLNVVMKILTSVTIIIAIPTMFASFWGMNVGVPFKDSPFGFWFVVGVAGVASLIAGLILWKKKML